MGNPTQTRRRPVGIDGTIALAAVAGLSIQPGDDAGDGPMRQTRITFNNVSVPITDAGSTGWGTLKLFDFPAGQVTIYGAVQNLEAPASAGGNVQVALGTTATADSTLSGTEVDICPASSAAASNADSARTAAPAIFNGMSTPVACHLNANTAGDPSSGATYTINGTVTITWSQNGVNV